MKTLITILLISLISLACAMPTQTEVNARRKSNYMTDSVNRYQSCITVIESKAENNAIYDRVVVKSKDATNRFDLLASSENLPENLKSDYFRFIKELAECRKTLIKEMYEVEFEFGQVSEQTTNEQQALELQLILKEKNIGQFNRAIEEVRSSAAAKFNTAIQIANQRLANMHNNELIQRKIAAQNAFNNYIKQESLRQQYIQNQILNSPRKNAPSTTNCQVIGNTLNCSTY